MMMRNFTQLLGFYLFFVANTGFPAIEKWTLTEKNVVDLAKSDAPDIRSIDVDLASAFYAKSTTDAGYRLNWISSASYTNSSEEGIISFSPTFGPTKTLSTGIQTAVPYGVNSTLSLVTDQRSTTNGLVTNATRTGAVMTLSVDLWKNLFGKLDHAMIQSADLTWQKAKLQREVKRRHITLQLRKIYWSIVANDIKWNISKNLLSSSEKQLRDGLKRRGQFTADQQEIDKYRSQVESRKSTVTSLEFQRGLLIQQLKLALPSIALQTVQLGAYNTQAKIDEVLVCAARLSRQKEVPWQYTKIDEIIELVEKTYQQKRKLALATGDVDLNLTSELRLNGVDNSISDSFAEFSSKDSRGAFSVGMSLTVPLGSSTRKAEEAKLQVEEYSFFSEKQKLLAEVKAKHKQIAVLVNLLDKSVKQIRSNNVYLERSVKASQQKFRQARIPLNTLITEQDVLFNSLLSEVDTKLSVIHTLLDYFMTFTEDPCSVNKLGA